MGQQEVDITAMAAPITKYAAMVVEPKEIRFHLEKAVWLATHGRKGPVWLDLPLDVQAAQIEPDALVGFTPPAPPAAEFAGPIAAALAALAQARRPVVYVGNGVRTAGAIEAFRALVERLKLPVLLTWKAADFLPEDHPAYIGRPGGMGQRGANFTQQRADWILVLGARLDLPSVAFNHANFAPRAFKVFVDVDPAELAKFKTKVDVPVAADLGEFLPALLAAADGAAEGIAVLSHLRLADDHHRPPLLCRRRRGHRLHPGPADLRRRLRRSAAGRARVRLVRRQDGPQDDLSGHHHPDGGRDRGDRPAARL
jgi:acetolactate synthase-1/2/3 large subunit